MLKIVTAGLLACAALNSRAVSFDEAKADASKRMSYLQQLLGPLVHDKAKNPKGTIKAWYYVQDEAQKKAAEDALRAEYKAEGREFFFARESKAIFAPLDSAARRAIVWYRDGVIAGSNLKAGILLVGDVFSLGSEDEVKNVIEDGALGYVKLREEGLKVGDLELDANIPALKNVSNRSLLLLWAQSGQLEAVLKGTRKVSDAFRQDLMKQYLATHQLWSKQFAHEKKIYDDNNENTLQKEIVDFLEVCFNANHERIKAAGWAHKLVSKENHEYSLEKK